MNSIYPNQSIPGYKKTTGSFLWLFALFVLLMLGAKYASAGTTSAIRVGFDSNTLAANDDSSTGAVDLGFNINFFGTGFNQVYVNNNGNITFDQPLSTFTPFGITNNTTKIIAPFFADVDTAVAGSSPVTYGTGTVGGRSAFGVNWVNVRCYATEAGGLNSFQLVLIDRSDIGAGDFDIEFNYGQIQWETGRASGGDTSCQGGSAPHIGYSNGSNASFELQGSGTPGYFLDALADGQANPTGLIYNSRNSLQSGRYIFEVRNGNAPLGHSIEGTIYGGDTTNPLTAALVQVCTAGTGDTYCSLTSTNSLGHYSVGGLVDGAYAVKAFAPANTQYQSASINTTLAGADLSSQDITLQGPLPLPNGTAITPLVTTNAGGQPVVYWQNPLTLSSQACEGGTVSYSVTRVEDGNVVASGLMNEDPSNPGHYSTSLAAFYPTHGWVNVAISSECPSGVSQTTNFSMYIDPSGQVIDMSGDPVTGATVTLFRSDSSAGPFTPVPDGSAIMDIENRSNPSISNDQGLFGWNVVSGYYKVRAQKAGCTSPTDTTRDYVDSPVLTIPPAVTDVQLQLSCPQITYAPCDVNQDGVISRADLSNIASRLRQTVTAGTLGDVNDDGVITTQDLRQCALSCTNAGCAGP